MFFLMAFYFILYGAYEIAMAGLTIMAASGEFLFTNKYLHDIKSCLFMRSIEWRFFDKADNFYLSIFFFWRSHS